MDSSKKINKEQREAIEHGDGPLLIVAGAGTGKTTVVTERIKYLISEKHALPTEILALTFTEKASREMEQRVDEVMPYGYTQMWISTFHSFCDRILRAEALHVGLDPKFKLMTSAETIQFIKKNLFNFELDYFRPLGNPTKFITGLVQHFSRLQDEDIKPDEYLFWVKDEQKKLKADSPESDRLEIKKWLELAEAYKQYDKLKIDEGVMDYGDLIVKTLHLFRQRPNILKKYHNKFKYVLVDEFQDTNVAQYELVKEMSGLSKNITVVFDDDQAIYRWRGAAVSNALQFVKDYPEAKRVSLVKNYRSQQTILDAAYKMIQNNNPNRLEVAQGINKKLISQVGDNGTVELIYVNRVENEAEAVAKKIEELSSQYDFSDFAILVRANSHADPFIKALNYHGIPNQFLGPAKLFKQSEISDLIAYLKVLYNFQDSASLYKLLSSSFINISGRDLIVISNHAKKNNISIFESCEKITDLDVSIETQEVIQKITKVVVSHLDLVKQESAGRLLYKFLEDMDLLAVLINPSDEALQRKAENVAKLFDKVQSYEAEHEDTSVTAVIDWIDLLTDLGESPLAADSDWSQENSVNILTIHGSKGLEFPVVFVVNLVSQRFPSIERKEQIPIPDELIKEDLPEGDYHLQEERRLFYVGTTRAKEKLYLTAANYYGEAKRDKKLSPFVFEILDEDSLKEIAANKKVPSILKYEDVSENKADQVILEKKMVSVDYLSYSQIETFNICPLHYKLKYIVKIPTPQSASQSFGTSMHAAIKSFYEMVISGEAASESLIHDCLSKNWISQGFENKDHEKKFLEKGRMYLSGYLKEGFDDLRLPTLMEEKFTISLQSEVPLKIGGIIDRVDVLPDRTLEIIDYKTSANIPTQKEIDKNLQLSFYALAAASITQKPFGVDPDKIKLSLYFFDTQEKITTTRTKEDLLRAKDEILATREEIERSDFACSGNFLCQNCEFKMFCKLDD